MQDTEKCTMHCMCCAEDEVRGEVRNMKSHNHRPKMMKLTEGENIRGGLPDQV